jgi:EAL domain-containing protein (putative c-di-GMP-specific phosphodiesterase class I)
MNELAHSMEMRVFVERVEENDQLSLLREMGADEVQGSCLDDQALNPAPNLTMCQPLV